MTAAQQALYLRARAERVLAGSPGDYPDVARQLAAGVLELLDARDTGRHLTDDRFAAELAELRDEVLAVSNAAARSIEDVRAWTAAEFARFAAATVANPVYRKSTDEARRSVDDLRLSHTMLDARVNALASRIEGTNP